MWMPAAHPDLPGGVLAGTCRIRGGGATAAASGRPVAGETRAADRTGDPQLQANNAYLAKLAGLGNAKASPLLARERRRQN